MKRIKETNRLLAENLVRSIMKDYEACGIAAAIIDKNGVTQYEKFWGVRDLESRKELDGETIFGLASVTKSFTALAIMQMEERGILKLDDPVSRYVPENRDDPTSFNPQRRLFPSSQDPGGSGGCGDGAG